MASDQATGGGGGCDFPMDAGGQEMLASFLWAVGEDAIGSRNGRAQPADVDDDDDDDEDNTSVDAMDGSQMHYASPTPAPEPAAAAPLPAQQAFPAQLPTPTAFAGHSPLPTAAIPSVAAFPLASESADVKLEGRDPAGPVPAPASAPAPLHQLPTANFNLPGMIPNPAGLDMFGHAMFNPLTAGLLPGMNHAALYGQAQMGNLALSQMGGLGLPPSANAFSRLLPLGMMPPSLPNPFAVGPQGAGSSSGEHARNNQRLQRKAESARVARVRKKHYVATLELENSELRAKLHALQNAQHRGEGMQQAASAVAAQQPAEQAHAQQQSDGTGVSAAERQAQSAMELKVQEMCDILQRHSIDRLTSDVNSLVEQFVANQRMRQRSINYHFNEITDLLDTGPQARAAGVRRAHTQAGETLRGGRCACAWPVQLTWPAAGSHPSRRLRVRAPCAVQDGLLGRAAG